MFFPAATFEGFRIFPFQTDKNILVYFDLHESLLHLILLLFMRSNIFLHTDINFGVRKYCYFVKMFILLATFSPIFAVDPQNICGFNFKAPSTFIDDPCNKNCLIVSNRIEPY